MLEPLVVDVFGPLGDPMFRLPYSKASWSDSISETGSLQLDVDYSREVLRIPRGLRELLKLWGVIIAAHRFDLVSGVDVVKHAGPLTDYTWDHQSRKLQLTCGGGWSLTSTRLVLNHTLESGWVDGDVLVDEEHPAGAWVLTLTGSYSDIARGLVAEAMKWGALPITLPSVQGGSRTRTYNGYDVAKVSDRLDELAKLADGNEIRFDPRLKSDGTLTFDLRSGSNIVGHEAEIIDHSWLEDTDFGAWHADVPGQRVKLKTVVGSGSGMTNQVYVIGGKHGDKTVMARVTDNSSVLPLLIQSADTTHTTATELATLRAYAQAGVAYGAYPDETFSLEVGEEFPVRPGDYADVWVEDDFLGDMMLQLKITDVDGSSDSDWLTVQARERG
ncbi:hypothetical protein [Bifidobacterium sp.]|jgi:hypothetical protein|uniref:hypothetical protein n=1 Tax=Bifidobacterium sp. TaxID=41200 RepID=UPI0025C4A2A7|nr:hypothetical protein [Bifidobacterium sp.]MCI1635213.1 hypothetical protein [Bifidobacterium sp.]